MERPHTGIPLSNGNLGALVWGVETLNVTVNQNDLWDHRGGELIDERDDYAGIVEFSQTHGCTPELDNRVHHPECAFKGRPSRLPVGRFDFRFMDGIRPVRAVLDYHTGSLFVTASDGSVIRLISVLKQNILYVIDPAGCIEDVSMHPASEFPKVKAANAARGIADYERIPDGWKICPPEDPEFSVHVQKTEYGYKVYTNGDGDDSAIRSQIAFTQNWWESFFERTAKITTPDGWWNDFFTFSLYKFGAMTCPFGKAGGLQGPWHEEYQECKWSGDFHFNVNVQMIYGPACALGVPEHLLPLFDMIESPAFQANMRHNARALFHVEDVLWQTHAVDDTGVQVGGLGMGGVLDPACGAWTALLYFDYYRYTCDVQFLRDRAWPYIYGIMRGYECMLDPGFNIPVAISAEYASSNRNVNSVAGRNPSYQLAAIRKLAAILIEAAAILGKPERPVWRRILEKVPYFTTASGYDCYAGNDEKRIAVWEGQDLEVCHRHHSHLASVWPFDSLPEHPDSSMEKILANSIDHWIDMGIGKWSEWCIPWAAIIHTRMGLHEAPMQLFNIWKEVFVNEGFATVYLPRMLSLIAHRRHEISLPKADHEIMQMDGTCGFLSAFAEMCAYTRFDKVHLFDGMPEKWPDVRVENLMLPGGGRLFARRGGTPEIRGGNRKIVFA